MKAGAYAKPFECLGEPERPVTEELCREAGVIYEEVFTKGEAMAALALKIKELDQDAFCKLPFSVTVEAEQFGATADLNPLYGVPAIAEFLYQNLDEIGELPAFDFTKGTMAEVLKAVAILSAKGEKVVLNLEGPFTILGLLVPSKQIYKGLYRKKDILRGLCERITEELVRYAAKAEEAGASLLSYADPTIAYDLVSPGTYKEICGEITYQAMEGILNATSKAMLHLCSATSVGFEKAGFCDSDQVQVPQEETYGQALAQVLPRADCRLLGHGCLQRSACPLAEACLYKLKLKQ